MTTQIDLERMTDDQLCAWVCARRGAYSAQERDAIHAFLDSMPHRAEAIPESWLKGMR